MITCIFQFDISTENIELIISPHENIEPTYYGPFTKVQIDKEWEEVKEKSIEKIEEANNSDEWENLWISFAEVKEDVVVIIINPGGKNIGKNLYDILGESPEADNIISEVYNAIDEIEEMGRAGY